MVLEYVKDVFVLKKKADIKKNDTRRKNNRQDIDTMDIPSVTLLGNSADINQHMAITPSRVLAPDLAIGSRASVHDQARTPSDSLAVEKS